MGQERSSGETYAWQRTLKQYGKEGIDISEVSERLGIPEEELASFRDADFVGLSRLRNEHKALLFSDKERQFERAALKVVQLGTHLKINVIARKLSVKVARLRVVFLEHDLHPTCKPDGARFDGKPMPDAMIVRKGSAEDSLRRESDSFDPDYIRARMKVLGAILEHDAVSIVQIEQATGLSHEVIEEVMVCEDLFEVILRTSRNFDLERMLFQEQISVSLASELLENMTYQAIYKYLETRGLKDHYKKVRERLHSQAKEARRLFEKKKKEEAERRCEMLRVLVQRGLDLAKNQDERDALFLRAMGRFRSYTYEQLLKIFEGHTAGFGVCKTATIAELGPKDKAPALRVEVHRAWKAVGRSSHHDWPGDKTPDDVIEVMRQLRSGGVPITEISRRVNISVLTVTKWTDGYEVVPKRRNVTPEEAAQMNLLRWGEEEVGEEKMSINEVAKLMGRSEATVRNHTRRD